MKNITVILILFFSLPLGALQHKGKMLYMYGDSAIPLGRGGAGIASSGIDSYYLNPASIADLERFTLGINYGTLPIQTNYYNPDISLAFPTSYGVMGGSVRYFNFSDSEDFRQGYALSFGCGKDITPQFLIGLSLDLFFGAGGSKSYYTGGNLGFIYKFDLSWGERGFGFFEPRIATTIHFGLPFGADAADANFNAASIGYQFSFYRSITLKLSFYNEMTALQYRHFPITFGLEAELFDLVSMRIGGKVLNKYDYGDITAGIGYKFKFTQIEGSVNYALCYYRDITFVHYIGLNFQISVLDREPPKTVITADLQHMSPNSDGMQDYIYFNLDVTDRSRIKGWRLQILDESQNLVAEYRMSDREIRPVLSLKTFFTRLIQKKESMLVPEKILWEGLDIKRQVVPDGRYYYAFNAWDERDNIAALKKGVIFVDNTSPHVELTAEDRLFSPNGDGKKDIYVINQKAVTGSEDLWFAGFNNSEGKTVKSYSWTGSQVPKQVAWDGRDDAGNEAPDGVYDYFIKSTDLAGNRASEVVKEISLTRKKEAADMTLSSEYHSYGKDREITLFPILPSHAGLDAWKVMVFNNNKKPVHELTGKEFNNKVIWDCRDSEGKMLNDGRYFIEYAATFQSGNMSLSFKKRLFIDSAPPDAGISHSPRLFSPDGDGESDILTILPEARDDSGIKNWKVAIFAPSGYIFKIFEGKGQVPKDLKWDGYSDSGEIMESAADYYMELEATDLAGNYAKTRRDRIRVDVLVMASESGLKIRTSNIEFGLGNADITRKGRDILNRVSEILQRYQTYNVVVEGHTDDIGAEEFNLDLSERRAKAVMDYLIDRGIVPERLSFMGMGETMPFFPNTFEENRRRNRRIEFLLLKKRE